MNPMEKAQWLNRRHAVHRLLRGIRYKTPGKIANTLKSRTAFARRKLFVDARPISLTVEPTNICNLKCPLCYTGSGGSPRRKGMMSLDDFCRIVDKVDPYLNNILIHNQGEPTLNPQLFDMIRYARHRGIRTIMSTNLTRFTDEISESIILSGLDTLVVSIDGVCQETYGRYRVGGDYAQVFGNLQRLVGLQKKMRRFEPHIVWSYLIFKHNVHEVEHATRLAVELGTAFVVQSAGLGGSIFPWEKDEALRAEWLAEEAWIPKKFRYDPGLTSVCRGPCDWLWSGFVVFWNGTVSPCCFVDDESLAFGNLLTDDLEDLWNSARYRSARSQFTPHPDRALDPPVICARCDMFEKPSSGPSDRGELAPGR